MAQSTMSAPSAISNSPPQVTPRSSQDAEHDQKEHVHGPGERRQTTDNAAPARSPLGTLPPSFRWGQRPAQHQHVPKYQRHIQGLGKNIRRHPQQRWVQRTYPCRARAGGWPAAVGDQRDHHDARPPSSHCVNRMATSRCARLTVHATRTRAAVDRGGARPNRSGSALGGAGAVVGEATALRPHSLRDANTLVVVGERLVHPVTERKEKQSEEGRPPPRRRARTFVRSRAPTSLTTFESQRRDLLRDEAHEEDDHGQMMIRRTSSRRGTPCQIVHTLYSDPTPNVTPPTGRKIEAG